MCDKLRHGADHSFGGREPEATYNGGPGGRPRRVPRKPERDARHRRGIEVVGQAENGKEAVRLAKQMRPDVVVMDLAMPVMGGKEATRLIVREVSQPPAVVILTMQDHARLVHELREIGASAFLTKSASLAELVAAVKEASATRPLGSAPDGAPPGSG